MELVVKFTKMKLENFLTLTDAEVKFDDRGLVLIQGINSDDTSSDSNGAGKSSLADGLCWTLYGVTARGVSGDDVINFTAGKGTMGQVDIDDNGEIYRVTRYRKHSKGKNSLNVQHLKSDGTINDLTKGTDKLTQEILTKILGASLDVFTGAIYAGQEKMPDLPAMTDKQLKLLLEEASGVTLLEEAYKEANKRLAAKKSERDQIAAVITQTEQQKSWIQDQITTETASSVQWQNNQKARINAGKIEISNLVRDIKNLDTQIGNVDFPALEASIADCDKRIASVSQEGVKLQQLNSAVVSAQHAEQIVRQTIQSSERELQRLTAELTGIQHKVGCPCNECGRPMTENELGAAKKSVSDKIAHSTKIRDEAKAELTKEQQKIADAQKAASDFQATMTDTSKVTQERAQIQSQINAGERLKSQRAQLASTAKATGERVKAITAELNPHEAALDKHRKKLQEAEGAGQDLLDKLKQVDGELKIAESVSKVFSPAGVRAHILDEVTPFLNQQTSKYLATLSDNNIQANWTTLVKNAKGELREKFSIEVEKKDRSKSFAGLSGGEKRKVRISAALALQDLVATRATKPIELFIGDEIDDALDPAGLERLMQILEDKAKERGSVFVISHNNLKDWISNIIQVESKNNKTIVSEITV
ncbi:AAA family ATPase [Galbibacter sp. BG1]